MFFFLSLCGVKAREYGCVSERDEGVSLHTLGAFCVCFVFACKTHNIVKIALSCAWSLAFF